MAIGETTKEQCPADSRGESLRDRDISGLQRTNNPEILQIAQVMENFIEANKWGWCDMNQVYRILKVVHGG